MVILQSLRNIIIRIIPALFLYMQENALLWAQPVFSVPAKGLEVINAIAVDHQNVKWIGSEKGLFKLENGNAQAVPVTTLPDAGAYAVNAIFIDQHNTKWLAAYSGKLLKLQPDGHWQPYDLSRVEKSLITSIGQLSGKGLLVATYGGGVIVFDENKGAHFVLNRKNSRLPDDNVNLVYNDSQQRTWVGTENGLCQIDPQLKISTMPLQGRITAIAEYKGQLWVAVAGNKRTELWKESEGKWKELEIPLEMQHTRIAAIGFGPDGLGWIAAHKIAIQNGSNGWDIYDQQHGFTSSMARCGISDRDGTMWLGTEGKGLFTNKAIKKADPVQFEVEKPKEEPLPVVETWGLNQAIRLNINFEQSKSVFTDGSDKELDRLFEMLNTNPDLYAQIEGHTDNVGNAKLNLKLSEERAKAVKDYLVKRGISAKRLITKGYGGSRPLADNRNPARREQNRRVEVVLRRK